MNTKLCNLITLPQLVIKLVRGLRYQKKFIQNTVAKDIENIKRENDSSLNDDDYKRILEYSLAVPLVLGEAFCILIGKSMSIKERSAMTYLAASTGLFDDFFDHKATSENQIQSLINNPTEYQTTNSHEKLSVLFYNKALENCADINLLKKNSYIVYQAQLLSKRQKSSTIEFDELKQITFQKGAAASLIYRSLLGNFESKAEELMIYKLGSLLQLEDDLFDIYLDFRNEINTLATAEKKISNFRKIYTLTIQETFELVHQTDFTPKNKKKFIQFISVFISRGFVCLDCLEKNEKLTNNIFSISEYKRADLICDMEKPKNIIKWLMYYVKSNFEVR